MTCRYIYTEKRWLQGYRWAMPGNLGLAFGAVTDGDMEFAGRAFRLMEADPVSVGQP